MRGRSVVDKSLRCLYGCCYFLFRLARPGAETPVGYWLFEKESIVFMIKERP